MWRPIFGRLVVGASIFIGVFVVGVQLAGITVPWVGLALMTLAVAAALVYAVHAAYSLARAGHAEFAIQSPIVRRQPSAPIPARRLAQESQSTPTPLTKEILGMTLSELVWPLNGLTSIQMQTKVSRDYVGRWIRVEGQVEDVAGTGENRIVKFRALGLSTTATVMGFGRIDVSASFRSDQAGEVSDLTSGDRIRVYGEIRSLHRYTSLYVLSLDNCQLEASGLPTPPSPPQPLIGAARTPADLAKAPRTFVKLTTTELIEELGKMTSAQMAEFVKSQIYEKWLMFLGPVGDVSGGGQQADLGYRTSAGELNVTLHFPTEYAARLILMKSGDSLRAQGVVTSLHRVNQRWHNLVCPYAELLDRD